MAPFSSDSVLSYSNIMDEIMGLISQNGAKLIIIEAAAGFGKTCTAYETLNEISTRLLDKCAFFAELSRNRENRTFKHVLLTEMDAEFPNMIHSELIIDHIHSGRIPLIIDGFDELLSKEEWNENSSSDNFSSVETMLTTIGQLLINNAKVILTSRKTAIFSGEDFQQWYDNYNGKFNVYRFSIDAPKVDDWLDNEKLEVLKESSVQLKHISNPVLLSYLRSLSLAEFREIMPRAELILDKYFERLLNREQERQNLPASPEKQLAIFQKLARLFVELNITAEAKQFVKELIIEYNPNTLPDIRKNYPIKPTIDELADTLTNHALLDRRDTSGNIGFINDFIYGIFIGNSICENLFRINPEVFPERLLELAVTSYKFYSETKRKQLWEIIKSANYNISKQFKLLLDSSLNDYISEGFVKETFEDYHFEDVLFNEKSSFMLCNFLNCKFTNCSFDIEIFEDTSFWQCAFANCDILKKADIMDYSSSIHTYKCTDYDSGFLNDFTFKSNHNISQETKISLDILSKLLKVDKRTPKQKKLFHLCNEFPNSDRNRVMSEIENLERNGYLTINGAWLNITTNGKNIVNAKGNI